MKPKRLSILTAWMLASTACAPVQQAPLVYSSSQQFGIGLAAARPESPGLDINIGYKGLDAAYVPVAVAKPCPASSTCPQGDYSLQIVQGTNSVSGKTEQNEKLIADKRKEHEAAVAVVRASSARMSEIDRDLAKIAKLSDKKSELATLTPDPQSSPVRVLSGAEQEQRALLAAEVAAIEKLAPEAARLMSERKSVESRSEEAAKQAIAAQTALDDLIARRNEMSADDKRDAFSVYGTFNGNAGGRANGAELSLGKVFSTGVAAQHLAQGVGASERSRSTASCLDSLDKVLGNAGLAAADKQKLLNQLGPRCGIGVTVRNQE